MRGWQQNRRSNQSSLTGRGSTTAKRVPNPTMLSALIEPPWASTISREMASPNPTLPVRTLDLSTW